MKGNKLSGDRRIRKRYKFNIYWDQYEALCDQAAVNKLLERPGGMSEMVREALDSYLSKRYRRRQASA
jgi:hypothetical protein